MKNQHVIVAGAGIGGLASALALAHAGQRVTVLERSAQFAPIGAGIQLGPNAIKQLARWGLREAVLAQACLPEAIGIHDAKTGRSIHRILLGAAVQQRYGEVYASIHRADLHTALLAALRAQPAVQCVLDAGVDRTDLLPDGGVQVSSAQHTYTADALIAADGVWSTVRQQMLADGAPRATGHAAYRALVPIACVPQEWRSNVGVWWASNVHVVHYPVRCGQFLNLVVLSERASAQATASWAQPASQAQVMANVPQVCAQLHAILDAASTSQTSWHSWHLYDRSAAATWVRGHAALLGDAAHPMLPYLAQGAAMAIEDAAVLAQQAAQATDWPSALQQYQQLRHARCARVVSTARRNGQIFHLRAPIAMVRDAVLTAKGTQVLGMPWLYGADVLATTT